MGEPDLMFLDTRTILFYTLCFVAFIAGVRMGTEVMAKHDFHVRIRLRMFSHAPSAFFLVPLILGTLLVGMEIRNLILNQPNLILMLLAQQGETLKADNGMETANSLMMAPIVLSGIVWWAYWRQNDLKLQGWDRRLVRVALIIAVCSVMVSSMLNLSRIRLLLVLIGLVLLYLQKKSIDRNLTIGTIVKVGFVTTIIVTVLFQAFSFLRSSENAGNQIFMFFGYTVASYNRLASEVNGGLHYPFAGRGVYLSSFVAYSSFLNKLFPIAKIMQWPDYYQLWASEFGAVTQQGLNGSMIWSGTFGYVYSELGWFSPLFIFMYGIFYAMVWRWLRTGKTIGIVLYPYLGFCILLWIATNALTDSLTVILFAVGLLMASYESLFAKVEHCYYPECKK